MFHNKTTHTSEGLPNLETGARGGRRFLKKLGHASIACSILLPVADNGLSHLTRTISDTSISVSESPYEQENIGSKFVNIGLPGFNASPEGLSNKLKLPMSPYGDILTVHYGYDLSPEVIADRIAEELMANYSPNPDRPPKAILYGHSMGGIISALVAARLIDVYGVEVAAIIFDGTPAELGDVRGLARQLPVAALHKLNEYGASFGPIARGSVEAFSSIKNDGKSIFDGIGKGIENAVPEDPAKDSGVLGPEASLIYGSNKSLVATREILAGIPKFYFGPENPANDTTVSRRLALDGLRGIFGDEIKLVKIPGGGHGIAWGTRSVYAKEINKVLSRLGISTIASRTIAARQRGLAPQATKYP